MQKLIYLIFGLALLSCNNNPKPEDNKFVKTESLQIDSLDSPIRIEEEISTLEPEKVVVDSNKCRTDFILHVVENKENLDTALISDLLRTIDNSCSNNVEFGEFSNETLFLILEKRPDLFLQSYESLIDKIDTAYILFEIRNPIHDLIPITLIIDNFKGLESNSQVKADILRNLKQGDWN